MFKIIQNCSDLSHASSGAKNGGTCSESCFLIFLKEQGTGKQGPKGNEKEESGNFSWENATKNETKQIDFEQLQIDRKGRKRTILFVPTHVFLSCQCHRRLWSDANVDNTLTNLAKNSC